MVDLTSLSYYSNFPEIIKSMNPTLIERNRSKPMTFVVCLGLPGSGKSTFTAKLQQRLDSEKINCGTVSRDMLRIQEDGTYMFDPTREPLVQDTHLELLYQLSEERNYNVVIIDDANLRYDQMLSTLLAIDHPENDVLVVDFEPMSPFAHLKRTQMNGHLIGMVKLVEMTRNYHETVNNLKHFHFDIFRIRSSESDALQMSSVDETVNKIVDRVKGAEERKTFHIINYYCGVDCDVKRSVFESYKMKLICSTPVVPEKRMKLVSPDPCSDEEDDFHDSDNDFIDDDEEN